MKIHPTAHGPRAVWPFLFPRKYLLFSHTHSRLGHFPQLLYLMSTTSSNYARFLWDGLKEGWRETGVIPGAISSLLQELGRKPVLQSSFKSIKSSFAVRISNLHQHNTVGMVGADTVVTGIEFANDSILMEKYFKVLHLKQLRHK